ncbi:MAG: FkbM family methyltransferase [Spirirestis rafaelensis WJT71-NPBG6]|jgi:FkbM family methyltransferase|nr:FkbM family methyltransferase [Spirirestis rafaelensis WJT71-NPBG6]
MKIKKYKQVKLPNGKTIFCLHKHEVQLVYKEVQTYFKNGIELHEGDTVFDVGANIGLFTLWVYHLCNQHINVYAFEPIPAIFEVLHANTQSLASKQLRSFAYGLSDESKTTSFAYYPRATIASQLYPGFSKEERNELKEKMLVNLQELPLAVSWIRWLPTFLRSFVLEKKLAIGFQAKQVNCQLRTLSEVIREHQIQRIDLLKVDVEKSELDVLLGIEKHDWQKIKQVVVEVHNFECRLEKIIDLLKKHRFNEITVEQEPILKGDDIFIVYAFQHPDR